MGLVCQRFILKNSRILVRQLGLMKKCIEMALGFDRLAINAMFDILFKFFFIFINQIALLLLFDARLGGHRIGLYNIIFGALFLMLNFGWMLLWVKRGFLKSFSIYCQANFFVFLIWLVFALAYTLRVHIFQK